MGERSTYYVLKDSIQQRIDYVPIIVQTNKLDTYRTSPGSPGAVL